MINLNPITNTNKLDNEKDIKILFLRNEFKVKTSKSSPEIVDD